MDISVVMPCLNEEETIANCINKAKKNLEDHKLTGEIIIADNGSTDKSIEIAKNLGSKIIKVYKKGYGHAVEAGINASLGKFIFIADSDESYNFNDIIIFYKKINEGDGFDIVQGSRFSRMGGKIEKNAMPLTHRYIGNPFFSFLSKFLYRVPFTDVYCGMKIIRNSFFKKIKIFSGGMIWCLEILIKSQVSNARWAELPITLHKDGRKKGKSHLRTIYDGLQSLKFLLICSPKSIFFFPSLIILLFPFVLIIKDLFQFDIIASINKNFLNLLTYFLCSSQIFLLGLYSQLRAESLGLIKKNNLKKFFNFFSLKKSLIINFSIILLIHYLILNNEINFLNETNIKLLRYIGTLIFINIIFNSFFVSLLRINK